MRDKKAWLRIVEAFTAVLIVASVLILIVARQPKQDNTDSIHEIQRTVLKQVSLNETLRGEILENNKAGTENYIKNNLPVYLNFTIRICGVTEICGLTSYIDKEIYADEMLITSNLTKYQPKKLKFFVWVE